MFPFTCFTMKNKTKRTDKILHLIGNIIRQQIGLLTDHFGVLRDCY